MEIIMETKTNSRVSKRTLMLTQLAVLAAIMFMLELTGIGYIPLGPLSVVIMMVPVIVGAVTMGVGASTFLGFVFGITSMMQCFKGHPLGSALLALDPYSTMVLNVGVRVLVGFLTGLIYRLIKKFDKRKTWSYAVTGLAGSLLNTVLYMFTLVLLFKDAEVLQDMLGTGSAPLLTFFGIAMAGVGLGALAEAGVCTVIGGIIAKILDKTVNKL